MATTRNTGIQIEGLTQAIRAMGRLDRDLAKEAKAIIREETKPVVNQARLEAKHAAPAAPSSTTWVGYTVTNQGAGIVLKASKYPRALATEFGAYTAMVGFDKNVKRRQTSLRSRTFRPHNPDGYVIQPTIRRMLPAFLDGVTDGLADVVRRTLDAAGVPRGS